MNVGELDLRTGEQENWPCFLLQAALGELAGQGSAEELIWEGKLVG